MKMNTIDRYLWNIRGDINTACCLLLLLMMTTLITGCSNSVMMKYRLKNAVLNFHRQYNMANYRDNTGIKKKYGKVLYIVNGSTIIKEDKNSWEVEVETVYEKGMRCECFSYIIDNNKVKLLNHQYGFNYYYVPGEKPIPM